MNYLHWDEQTITDFDPKNVSAMYDKGYVFTRLGKGVMQQTRSVRIDLSKFELSSENRRILKKVEDIILEDPFDIPYIHYNFTIGKLAKDFYEVKFGKDVMSANKIKTLLTDSDKSSFNVLLSYIIDGTRAAYAVCYKDNTIFHYSYPFYTLHATHKDIGLGMMLKAIVWAKENKLKYIYLGSLQRPTDTYKLQFAGLEWFDGKAWKTDVDLVKNILKSA